MKKIISILLILLILCGCSKAKDDYYSALNNAFAAYPTTTKYATNNNTKYYSFYLPSDVGEYEFDDTFHHLKFFSSDFVMNLNVNYILCDKVFSTKPDNPFSYLDNYVIYEIENKIDETNLYNFRLYEINNHTYFSYYTDKLTFFGITDIREIKDLLPHLFTINASTKLDYNGIVNAYYFGTTIEYTQPELELFDKYIPPEGSLDNLLNPKNGSRPSTPEETDELESQENEVQTWE